MSVKYSNIKNLIKPGITDNSANITVINDIISLNISNQNEDNSLNNVGNTTETKGVKQLKKRLENDAALIPLHDESRRFNLRK
jgi:hypothetical protein